MRNDAVEPSIRARAVAAAQGREPFDLLLAGGTVVDVGCGELRAADVGIVGPLVASVHERGTRTDTLDVLDCTDRYVAPGFVDMHVHFESSMLTPGGYAAAVCPRGTTTVFIDPHELANVSGVAGVRYALEPRRGPPVLFFLQTLPILPPQPVAATGVLFAVTLLTDGGIDHLLRRIVSYGLDPILALRIATYNAAYRLQRADLGLVAAGHRADVVVLTDLESFTAEHVLTDGRLVASNGEMLVDVVEGPSDPPLDTMKLAHLDPSDMMLRLDAPDGP